MNMFKKNGGFTLVELIVVIAILAILAGVAVPAYNGYIKKAQDTAVITELSAIHTAAQAANATAGEIEKIEVNSTGTTITITAKTALSSTFASDFAMFYKGTVAPVSGNNVAVTVTLSGGAAFVNLANTSYANGATWSATATGSLKAGWNANPASTGSGT